VLRAQEKNLEFILDIPLIKSPFVRLDPGRLRQILTNLVGNAIKFTSLGEVILTVKIHEQTEKGCILECQVKDTGIGIPESQISKLFDAFTQVDDSTTRAYGGTGLGLAISKNLCELMGGQITVSSQEGIGSSFSFSIPLEFSHEEVQPNVPSPTIDIEGTHILIVDDNNTNRALISKLLKSWGAIISEAENAKSALNILLHQTKNKPIGIVFIDMNMPETNGINLAQNIRMHQELIDTKLIMMTSLINRVSPSKLMEVGVNAQFLKPANRTNVLYSLNQVLNARSSDETPKGNSKDTISTLPMASDEKAVSPQQTNEQRTKPINTHILLVEDNLINQEVALGMLEAIGLTCDIANNGLEALDLLKASQENKRPYSLIIMDCQMPELDGYETTKRIRHSDDNPYYQDIPIIALTANALATDRDKCLSTGMSDYLSKPIDPIVLEAKLTLWLELQSVRNDSTNEPSEGSPEEITPITAMSPDAVESTPSDIWDQYELLGRVAGKEELLFKLIHLFLAQIPDTLLALKEAIHANEPHKAAETAHNLKGSAGNLSARTLMNLAKELEAASHEHDFDKMTMLWPTILEHSEQLQALLKTYIEQNESTPKNKSA